jgi:hypothetical protein
MIDMTWFPINCLTGTPAPQHLRNPGQQFTQILHHLQPCPIICAGFVPFFLYWSPCGSYLAMLGNAVRTVGLAVVDVAAGEQ